VDATVPSHPSRRIRDASEAMQAAVLRDVAGGKTETQGLARARDARGSGREGTAVKTNEESLECVECPWIGQEDEATRIDDPPDDWWFACPKCGCMCAHVPIDELGREK
jgi:hypothetical protein